MIHVENFDKEEGRATVEAAIEAMPDSTNFDVLCLPSMADWEVIINDNQIYAGQKAFGVFDPRTANYELN